MSLAFRKVLHLFTRQQCPPSSFCRETARIRLFFGFLHTHTHTRINTSPQPEWTDSPGLWQQLFESPLVDDFIMAQRLRGEIRVNEMLINACVNFGLRVGRSGAKLLPAGWKNDAGGTRINGAEPLTHYAHTRTHTHTHTHTATLNKGKLYFYHVLVCLKVPGKVFLCSVYSGQIVYLRNTFL